VYIFGRGAAREIAEEYGIPFLGAIPLDPRIRECNDTGRIFLKEYPDSEAAQAIRDIVGKVIDIVENGKARIPEVKGEEE
jgi:ATP-binding protein involved in chromosome partitioning